MNLKNCDAQINNIKMKIQQSTDRTFSFKHEILQIMNESDYFLQKDDQNNWQVLCKFTQ
jgi:hypothetical protein